VSDSVRFNATADHMIDTWSWFVDGIDKGNNNESFIYDFSSTGMYEVKVEAFNNTNGTSNSIIWNVNVIDITPPANVSNLSIADKGYTFIKWTWENPSDKDFNGTRILMDNAYAATLPGTSNDYNATGLAPGTPHRITVVAFDNSGNNATQPWPENTSATRQILLR